MSEVAKLAWGAISLFIGIQVGLALNLHGLVLAACVGGVGGIIYTVAEMLHGFRPEWIIDEMRLQVFDASGHLLKKRAPVHVNVEGWPSMGKVAEIDVDQRELLVRFPDKKVAAFPMEKNADGNLHVPGIFNEFIPIH